MHRYIALLTANPVLMVSCFHAPGCHAMGDTIDEALFNARSALTEWLGHSRAHGMDIPEPRSVDELLKDLEVIEDIKATGAVMQEI